MNFRTLSAFLILASTVSASVFAATITVTETHDELNNDGDCSLREAVISANSDTARDACGAGSGADTIVLPAGTYALIIPGPDLVAESGDLDILQSVTITGAGAATTIIDASALGDRVFEIDPLANLNSVVTISGVTMQGAHPEVNESGGGIYVGDEGTLRLIDSRVADNHVTGTADGGGIAVADRGSLIVTGSVVTGNSSERFGGGISDAFGWVQVMDGSEISENTSTSSGGGIYIGEDEANLEISGSRILNNVSGTTSAGAGVYTIGTTDISSSEISGNHGQEAAGLYLGNNSRVSDTVLNGNASTTEGSGGGVMVNATAYFTRVTVTDNTAEGRGGGIYVEGALLTLEDSDVSGNTSNSDDDSVSSSAGSGGGISSTSGGRLVIRNSSIQGNTANRALGGGIYADGYVLLEDSEVTDNTATDNNGGGVYSEALQCLIRSSTVSGNSAFGDQNNSGTLDSRGGGLYVNNDCTIANTTVSGNQADGGGGGIFNAATLRLDHVTITGNTADRGVGGASNDTGGGLHSEDLTFVVNSIIAGNTDAGTLGTESPDCYTFGHTTLAGVNIIQDTTGCNAAGNAALTVNPLFDTAGLSDNGGPTRTISLQSGSPAIDAGDDSACLPTDQRGAARPVDGNGDSVAHCDLGAVEMSSSVPTLAAENNGDAQSASGGCSLIR